MKKIMIIDDDLDQVDSLRIVLETKYTVVDKNDTDNVVQAIKDQNPDMIILDVMFPEDPNAGFTAAREIASDDVTGKIPVIILSAVNTRSDLSFSFSESDANNSFMPVRHFLEKPVEPKRLLELAAEMVGQ
jgi:CheY-like chemotaxis protein